MRAKRSSLIGESPLKSNPNDLFAIEDAQGGRHDAKSPSYKGVNLQKHTIAEYDNQLINVKKTKDLLV
jgi:hypothetical protein